VIAIDQARRNTVAGGFVRAARASDAPGLARVQVASWRAAFAGLVPDAVIAELTSQEAIGQFTARWEEAIAAPPTSKHHVHVAVEKPGDPEILGFAASGPTTDEDRWPGTDGELYELHVLPSAAAEGHDERLLNAVADTLAEDGFSTGYTWSLSEDAARIGFLEAAGWAQDGTQSNLDMGVKVPVLRLHTRLSPAA
jgi:ribosomal protein S18 acetylase RimI-like enzyme